MTDGDQNEYQRDPEHRYSPQLSIHHDSGNEPLYAADGSWRQLQMCKYNSRMAKQPDVAIVGGGIIGLTCAYFLARSGFSVSLFDRGELGKEASWAGAGIIPPGNPLGAATPLDRLRAIGSMRFPGFSEELRELTGIDNGYVRCGGIEFLDDEIREVLNLWTQEGIAFEKLPAPALANHEPGVEFAPGEPYLLPGCAQVRNPRHLKALVTACDQLGVGVHPLTPVEAIVPGYKNQRRGVCHVRGRGKVEADRILVAAGPWTDMLITPDNHRGHGIHPVRGQIVLLKPATRVISHVLMHGKRYLVPRIDGRILIGSTEEPEAHFEKANTAEGVSGLLSFATRLVPALAAAELERCWSGLRPATRDGLPFIGPVPGWDNVFVATGHFRAGVQLSIGTAQAITERFTGKPTCVPLQSFAVDRKEEPEVRAAFRS
jgi:glycine oxidase